MAGYVGEGGGGEGLTFVWETWLSGIYSRHKSRDQYLTPISSSLFQPVSVNISLSSKKHINDFTRYIISMK